MGVKVNALINYESQSPYIEAVSNIKKIISSRLMKIHLWPDILFRILPEGRGQDKCLKVLHEFSDKVIRERKLTRKQNLETKSDALEIKKHLALLDLLLEASDNGRILSDSDIREEVDTFMFEGHDTTAVGISWVLFLLGHNHHIQQKVHEELDSILGDDRNKHPTIYDLKQMKYLECVIKESQRFYPSVSLLGRKIETNTELDGKIIPSGAMVGIPLFLLHRDPVIFPDPEKFDPSRFSPENCLNRSPFAYVPFSAGPRNCIGQKFAMLELKAVLSCVLRSFTIESLDPQDKAEVIFEVVSKPKNGINVRLTPRGV